MNRALINASSGIVQKPLRYVLYVRKSSEDAEAQAKSLPDQIADYKEYANKKMQEATVEKHKLLDQKTQKQRKIDDLAEKYAELDKESPKAVKDKLKKDMADLQNDVVNIDERIKQIKAKIKNPEKLRMTIEKFSNSLNSLINRLEKGDLVEKDILVRNMVSNLEIDAQKRVIYRYKSPFNFIFEPEFSTSSPVGEPGGTRTHDTKLKRLVL